MELFLGEGEGEGKVMNRDHEVVENARSRVKINTKFINFKE